MVLNLRSIQASFYNANEIIRNRDRVLDAWEKKKHDENNRYSNIDDILRSQRRANDGKAAKEKIKTLEKDNTTLVKKIKLLEDKITSLSANRNDFERKRGELERDINSLREENSIMKSKLTVVENNLRASQGKSSIYNDIIGKQRNRNKTLETDLANINRTFDKFKNDRGVNLKILSRLRSDNDSLTSSNSTLKFRQSKLENVIGKLKSSFSVRQSNVEEKHRGEIEDHWKFRNDQRETIGRLNKSLRAVKKMDVSDGTDEDEVDELTHKNTLLTTSNENLKEKISNLRKEFEFNDKIARGLMNYIREDGRRLTPELNKFLNF